MTPLRQLLAAALDSVDRTEACADAIADAIAELEKRVEALDLDRLAAADVALEMRVWALESKLQRDERKAALRERVRVKIAASKIAAVADALPTDAEDERMQLQTRMAAEIAAEHKPLYREVVELRQIIARLRGELDAAHEAREKAERLETNMRAAWEKALQRATKAEAERDAARAEVAEAIQLLRDGGAGDPHKLGDSDASVLLYLVGEALEKWQGASDEAEAAERRAEKLAAVVEAVKSWLIMWDHWRGTASG